MFIVIQHGFDVKWCKTPTEVSRYLCNLFGLDYKTHFLPLHDFADSMQEGQKVFHDDLALEIQRDPKSL